MRGEVQNMVGRMLRRHGFVKAKLRPIFFRHSLGLGGVYVWLLGRTYRLVVREHDIDRWFNRTSELELAIEQLERLEQNKTIDWLGRFFQLKREAKRILAAQRIVIEHEV